MPIRPCKSTMQIAIEACELLSEPHKNNRTWIDEKVQAEGQIKGKRKDRPKESEREKRSSALPASGECVRAQTRCYPPFPTLARVPRARIPQWLCIFCCHICHTRTRKGLKKAKENRWVQSSQGEERGLWQRLAVKTSQKQNSQNWISTTYINPWQMWQQKSAKLLYIRVRARTREGLNPNRSLDRYSADSYEEDNFLPSFIFLLAPFYSLWSRQNMKTPHLREKVRCFPRKVPCFPRKVACIFPEELVLWGVCRSSGGSK